jgi:hypothetical protein
MASSHRDFSLRLSELLLAFGHKGTGAAETTGISSNKNLKSNIESRALGEYAGGTIDRDWYGARKIGYLAAYVDFFGPRFSYEKLVFSDGEIHPDKANMKTYIKYDCVQVLPDGHVALTEKGRALIAPYVLVGDAEMESAYAC